MTQVAEKTEEKNEVSLKLAMTNEFLGYVASAAIEGGINHWARGQDYNPDDEVGSWITIKSAYPTEDNFPKFRLDRALLVRGIQLIVDDETRPVNRAIQKTLIIAIATDDAGDVDAEVADCIVQVGAFGELVYA